MWGQACWRESGGRGAYTLAPLPWVTLLLSFCALVSLRPPSSSSSSLLRSHSSPLLLATSSSLLLSSGKPKHFQKSGDHFSWQKKKPIQNIPPHLRPLDACSSANAASVTEKKNTLVNSHGSFQSPWMVTNRAENLLGLKHVYLSFFFFVILLLFVKFVFVQRESQGQER